MIYNFFLDNGSTNLSVCRIEAAHSAAYMLVCFMKRYPKLPC